MDREMDSCPRVNTNSTMSITSSMVITYPARCKDCDHIRYFFVTGRKRHRCIKRDKIVALRDKACGDMFVLSHEGSPRKLLK
jgi:hypothetical protein